jgi:acyl-coenzyme A thioesterase PaaI-like protein
VSAAVAGDVPAGFAPLDRRSPYIAAMGPFHWKADGKVRVLGLRAEEKHINSRGFVHGGVLCGMADLAIGYNLAYLQEPPLPLVTANLSVDFAGSARQGDWLECRVDIQRVGGRLAFANAYIWRGAADRAERIIRASAIFARADGAAA